ncbi:MAG: hypothetical protein ACFBSC_11040 [Microcoleaceae cyanobacterium]
MTILVDAHVHIYDCFQLDNFLNSALENFQKCASSDAARFVLCFTETQSDQYFAKLMQYAESGTTVVDWTFHPTQEPESIHAKHRTGKGMWFLAGRQVVTSERLEVSALVTSAQIPDGLTLDQTLQAIHQVGGLSALPWGVGKWMGSRGKLVAALLTPETQSSTPLFLSDNGGRPGFWPWPPCFKQAQELGWKVLSGTDPLPLKSESSRPGGFGFQLAADFDLDQPGQSLKQALLDPQTEVQPYGTLENPLRFTRNQVALRLP